MSVYNVIFLLTMLTTGVITKKIDTRYSFLISSGMTGVACALFGLLHYVDHGRTFLYLTFIVKGIEAVATAIMDVTITVIISRYYKENKGLFVAVREAFTAFGLCVGPPLGGFIYEDTNFSVPFISIGISVIVSTFLTVMPLMKANATVDDLEQLKEEADRNADKIIPLWKMIILPGMWVGTFSSTLQTFSRNFINIILEPYIRVFHYSAMIVSLFFVLPNIMSSFLAPVMGKLMDNRMVPPFGFILIGAVTQVIGFIFLGPIPADNPQLWSVILSCIFLGLGNIAMSLPGLIHVLKTLKANHLPESDAVTTRGVSIWYCFKGIGGIIGPPLGGIMYDNLGMSWTCSTFAIINGIFLILISYQVPMLQRTKQ